MSQTHRGPRPAESGASENDIQLTGGTHDNRSPACRCIRCNRRLTAVRSTRRGAGPVCYRHIQAVAA